MKRRAFMPVDLMVKGAGLAVLLLLVWAIFWPVYASERDLEQVASCQHNLKDIGLGISMYAHDYNDTYPRTATSGTAYGWADAIQPYLRDTRLYQCPSEYDTRPGTDPRAPGYTDYWLNANVSGRSVAGVRDPALTIMAGEGNAGIDRTDARYAKWVFPSAWLRDEASPAYRHMERMNLLFADGHVKGYSGRSLTEHTSPHLKIVESTPMPLPAQGHTGGRR